MAMAQATEKTSGHRVAKWSWPWTGFYAFVLLLCVGIVVLHQAAWPTWLCTVMYSLVLLMLSWQWRVLELDADGLTLHCWTGMKRIRFHDVHEARLLPTGATLIAEDGQVLFDWDLGHETTAWLGQSLDTFMDGTPTHADWSAEEPIAPRFPWQDPPTQLIIDGSTYEYGDVKGSFEDIAELRGSGWLRLVDDAGETRLRLPARVASRRVRQIVGAAAAARPSERPVSWSRWQVLGSLHERVLGLVALPALAYGAYLSEPVSLLLFAAAAATLLWKCFQERLVGVGTHGLEIWSPRRGQRVLPWSRIDGLGFGVDAGIFVEMDGSPIEIQLPGHPLETMRQILAIGGHERLRQAPSFVSYARRRRQEAGPTS